VLELQIEPHGDATFKTEFIGSLRGVDTTGEPLPPTKGKPTRRSQKYSDEIGKVLKTVTGLRPAYQLTGDELYVRAVVTSSEPPQIPAFKGQFQQAWTQPVGWKLAPITAPDSTPQ
jgi:hypothetical protein